MIDENFDEDDIGDRLEREDAQRDESVELRAANRRDLREEKIETLRTGLTAIAREWKVDFRVGTNGVEMYDGDRRVATIDSPMDAQRLMEIIGTYAHVSRIAVNSLEVVSDLHRFLYGETEKKAIRFVTDSNYILEVLKGSRPLVGAKESLDKGEAKA